MNYAYSRTGEKWIGVYKSREDAIVAGISCSPKEEGQTTWHCHIGTVVLPQEILEREKEAWIEGLLASAEGAMEDEMPWASTPIMLLPAEARATLQGIILHFLRDNATFHGFAVENVERVVLQERLQEDVR